MKTILLAILCLMLTTVTYANNSQYAIKKVQDQFSKNKNLVFQEVRFISEQLQLETPPVGVICYSAGRLAERLFQLSQESHLLTNTDGEILENLDDFYEKVYQIKYYSIDSFCGINIGVQGNVTSEEMKNNKKNIIEYFSELSVSYENIINY